MHSLHEELPCDGLVAVGQNGVLRGWRHGAKRPLAHRHRRVPGNHPRGARRLHDQHLAGARHALPAAATRRESAHLELGAAEDFRPAAIRRRAHRGELVRQRLGRWHHDLVVRGHRRLVQHLPRHRHTFGLGVTGEIVLDDGLELLAQILAVPPLLVQHLRLVIAACLTVEPEPIQLLCLALALGYQPDGARPALRRVRHARRQQEHLALADGHVLALALLQNLEHHVALELVEELLALVDMKILPGVGPSNGHHQPVALPVDHRIAHGRRQPRRVLLRPLDEVDGLRRHGARAPARPARGTQ
mmetsp:Transcript_21472/g.66570  ORF Transcript_21472/g.66570 Transcript_21472/m.66570 type:complete len:303 (+) Transcript_21472:404-1312(+)